MPDPGRPGSIAAATPDRTRSPGPGWSSLRLPERSQSEGDGLTADLTDPLSLGDANTARVAVRPVTRIRCNPSDAEEDTGSG